MITGQADQVVAYGARGLSASCPVDREVVFGFAMQRPHDPSRVCVKDAQTACTPGATSCSQPQCNTGPNDHSAMFVACAPTGIAVDASAPPTVASAVAVGLSCDGRAVASCPVGSTAAFGQALMLPHPGGLAPIMGAAAGTPYPYDIVNTATYCATSSSRECLYGSDACTAGECTRPGHGAAVSMAMVLCYPDHVLHPVEALSATAGVSEWARAPVTVSFDASNDHGSTTTVLDTMFGSPSPPATPAGLTSVTPPSTGGVIPLEWPAPISSTGGAVLGAGSLWYEAGVAHGACPTQAPAPPPVVTSGLVLHLDAGDPSSLRPGDTLWRDISGTLVGDGDGARITGTQPRSWRRVRSTSVDGSGVALFATLGLEAVVAVRLTVHSPGAVPWSQPPSREVVAHSLDVTLSDGTCRTLAPSSCWYCAVVTLERVPPLLLPPQVQACPATHTSWHRQSDRCTGALTT